jgi:tetratricopeptide (TPR) repeat protein
MHQLSAPSNARDAYQKGIVLRAKMDCQGALAQFEYAIKFYPSFYEAYAEMGVVQYILGDSTRAKESVQKSIDLSSHKYREAMFYLAGIFNISKRFAAAESLARQGLTLDDASWRGQLEFAKALFGMKRLAEAEQCASKSRDLNPNHPPTYLMLADIHIAMHHYDSALPDNDTYLKLDPNGPASRQVRATHDQLERALQQAQPQPVHSLQGGDRADSGQPGMPYVKSSVDFLDLRWTFPVNLVHEPKHRMGTPQAWNGAAAKLGPASSSPVCSSAGRGGVR